MKTNIKSVVSQTAKAVGEELYIAGNYSLLNLNGIENITSINKLTIDNNRQLENYCIISKIINKVFN